MNSIIKYKESFIEKVKYFFRKIFKNEKNDYEEIQNSIDLKNEKVNTKIFSDKELFLNVLNGSNILLNTLPIESMMEVKNYYDEIINKNYKVDN